MEEEERRRKKKKYMNKEMQIFDYDGMNIETIMWENHKGKVVPYFKATEIAKALGYVNPDQAIRTNSKRSVKLSKLDLRKHSESLLSSDSSENNNLPTPYQQLVKQGLSHNEIVVKNIWINEFDVYRLIMKSQKPDVEKFQDWLYEEVIPAISKDGMYIAGEEKVESGEMSIEEMTLKVHEYLQNKVNRFTLNDYFEINSLPTLA
ncbi:BRO-N domain-containing protein [Vibrio parahaemolyticus]|uniref:BRO-N domain-containing protein n=1 Tax=Vibrio parahaemolyticus TaxID=670 RepID=UPI0009AF81B7|nr:BRO family protein [Vibrio parahaemolyticus]